MIITNLNFNETPIDRQLLYTPEVKVTEIYLMTKNLCKKFMQRIYATIGKKYHNKLNEQYPSSRNIVLEN